MITPINHNFDDGLTMTIGPNSTENCYIEPWHPVGYPPTNTIVYWPPIQTEPTDCIGRAHVFECDHERACKCGKVKRSNPKRPAEK